MKLREVEWFRGLSTEERTSLLASALVLLTRCYCPARMVAAGTCPQGKQHGDWCDMGKRTFERVARCWVQVLDSRPECDGVELGFWECFDPDPFREDEE